MVSTLLKKRWVQEVIIFCCMFILTTLDDWLLIDTVIDFTKGMTYFLLLYGQAQFHRFYIFPFFLRKKIALYAALTIAALLIGSIGISFLDRWLYPEYESHTHGWEHYLYYFATCAISVTAMMTIFMMKEYYEQQQKRNADAAILQDVQLKLLHAQLNPHFFFNTLNNLYGISLQQPAKIPDLIMRLSKLMRYQVESSRKQWVSLSEEIDFITNFISIEKERLGARCDIQFQVTAEFEPSIAGQKFPPLMLMPLVENAFKHGTGSPKGSFVRIAIQVSEHTLLFTSENSVQSPEDKRDMPSTGLGLINTQHRLDLLFPSRYRLTAERSAQAYRTLLEIELKSFVYG